MKDFGKGGWSVGKYNAKKAKRGNLTFDSQAEARRYDELILLLRAGQIRNLQLQKTYCLQEPFTGLDGRRVLGVDYKADFDYERKTAPDRYGNICWLRVTEDVKGVRTESYSIKARMFHARYGYAITEISARRYR